MADKKNLIKNEKEILTSVNISGEIKNDVELGIFRGVHNSFFKNKVYFLIKTILF